MEYVNAKDIEQLVEDNVTQQPQGSDSNYTDIGYMTKMISSHKNKIKDILPFKQCIDGKFFLLL